MINRNITIRHRSRIVFCNNPTRGSLFATAPGGWAVAAGAAICRMSMPANRVAGGRAAHANSEGYGRSGNRPLANTRISRFDNSIRFCTGHFNYMGLVEPLILLPLAQHCIQRRLCKLEFGRINGVPITRLLRLFNLKVNRVKRERT